MRVPLNQFLKRENIGRTFFYAEVNRGRIAVTKVGAKSFIDDDDAAAWRALARKTGGDPGEIALQQAQQAVEAITHAIEQGTLKRRAAINRLRDLTRAAGLSRAAA
jgi:hypothetical protein